MSVTAPTPQAIFRLGLLAALVLRLPVTFEKAMALQERGLRVPWPGVEVPARMALWAAAVWTVAALMLATPWAKVASWSAGLAVFAYLLVDRQLYSNHLYLIAMLCCLLGAASSWRWDGRSDPDIVQLVKVQISVMYVYAGLTKLNIGFLSGGVLATALRGGRLPVPEWLLAQPPMMALSAVVPLVEVAIGLGLWHPRWRRRAAVLGLLLHGGIVIAMSPLFELLPFAIAALSTYPLFFDPTLGRWPTVRARRFAPTG